MEMMKASMQSEGVTPEIPTQIKKNIFPNCKNIAYHPASKCFKLDISKDKQPPWY